MPQPLMPPPMIARSKLAASAASRAPSFPSFGWFRLSFENQDKRR
jgi:hypothetical protein